MEFGLAGNFTEKWELRLSFVVSHPPQKKAEDEAPADFGSVKSGAASPLRIKGWAISLIVHV
jgi:hypothetical protein